MRSEWAAAANLMWNSRGELNIEGMPVFRDMVGGVGTPTSDNERTKIDVGTTSILVV